MVTAIDKLAPGFLVAAPMLRDPNFERTVVLMCIHNKDGALGLVINRAAPLTMQEIMEQLGLETRIKLPQRALVGGPVALDSGLLLYVPEPGATGREDEIAVTDSLRLCPSRDLLQTIGRGSGPPRYHMFLGHAGWGPGQVEGEIAQGAWIPAPLSLELIFRVPFEERWDEALRNEGFDPGQMGSFVPRA